MSRLDFLPAEAADEPRLLREAVPVVFPETAEPMGIEEIILDVLERERRLETPDNTHIAISLFQCFVKCVGLQVRPIVRSPEPGNQADIHPFICHRYTKIAIFQ